MTEEKWNLLVSVEGELQAEILRGLLEAQGVPVILNQEGAGRVYGLNVGALGEVQILIPEQYQQQANQILDDYYSGKFAAQEGDQPEETGE